MDVSGKTIVITGAGSGMGQAVTVRLCGMGARVIGADINQAGLDETAALVGNTGNFIEGKILDISDADAVKAFARHVADDHGGADILINNAGIIHTMAPVETLKREQVERVFNVNWWGLFNMTTAFLDQLKAKPEARIVNLSSMGGFFPYPGQVIYGATKAAVKLFSEGMLLELRDTNVGVTLIMPGAVSTNIGRGVPGLTDEQIKQMDAAASQGGGFGITSDKAAEQIVGGILRNKKRVLVGPDSKLIDKFYRIAPFKTAAFMVWLTSRASAGSQS